MKKLNISVLIIDKNKEIQKQLCSSLENIVNTIYFADTCKSAYNIYKISKIDLIISSKEEPISNNLDFFKEIRKEQINLPFVICVNKDDSDFLVEFIKLKSIHFLIKPLNIEDLKFIIDSLSELKCKNEELIFQNNLFNQYKNIVDISNLVSKADKNGKITFVNKEFCRISGFSEEDLIGKNYNIIRHPLMRKEIFKEMWTTIQKKNIWRGIIHNKSKNGETYTVDTTISPILNSQNEIIEYISIRKDITNELKQEKIIIKEKNKFKKILNNVDNIIIMMDNNKNIDFINNKFFEYFNYKNIEDFKEKHSSISDIFEIREGFIYKVSEEKQCLDNILNNNHLINKVLIIDKYKNEVIFDIKINKLYNKENDYNYIINLFDITELELAKKKAEKSEEIKSYFLSNMSHEIRTPMNGIIGFLDILNDTELDETQKKYLQVIDKNTNNLLSIVNDILDFSKLESGKYIIEETNGNLIKELKQIIDLFSIKIKERKIKFNFEYDSIPNLLTFDFLRIRQIVSNLLSNSLKFTPENGEITLYVKLENNLKLKIGVKDNGIGIPKNKHKDIFESFSQADNSITRKFGGTGLGLSISNSLLNLMNSKLNLESAEGKGSDFYFYLNFNKCELKSNELINQEQGPDKKRGNILIAEDNDVNQMIIGEYLRILNFKFDVVDNGIESLNKIENNKYDLILMDISMPIMGGIETLEELKKQGNLIPVIALTAFSMNGDKEKFLEMGFDDYLSKPVKKIELLNTLNTYFK